MTKILEIIYQIKDTSVASQGTKKKIILLSLQNNLKWRQCIFFKNYLFILAIITLRDYSPWATILKKSCLPHFWNIDF